MSETPPKSALRQLRERGGRGAVIEHPASHNARRARQSGQGRPVAPGEELGPAPKGRSPGWRAAWKRAERDWPHLDRRDREVLTDFLDLSAELEKARADLDRFGRLDGAGRQTDAYRVFMSLHDRVAKLRRDLAATTATRPRGRVPVRESKSARPLSVLAALRESAG